MNTFRSALSLALLSALAAPALYAAPPLLEPADAPLSEVGFADFNNDGRSDMAVRVFSTGDIRVSYNIGNRFSATPDWIGYAGSAPDGVNWDTLFADIDGDGLADSVDRNRSDGNLCVHRNLGTSFATTGACVVFPFSRPSPRWRTFLAPIDGDARADLVSIDQQTGTIYVHHNNSTAGTPAFDATPLFTQTVAVPSYPTSGWQQFVADCTGDGKADLINLDQTSSTFYCHAYGTTSYPTTFAPVTGVIFQGPPEIYERELAFGQFDAGGIADIVSHDLRTGDIVVLPVLPVGDGRYTGHRALLRDRSPSYTRPYAQQPLPFEPNRSVASIVSYDHDRFPGNVERPPGLNGWWYLYADAPNEPTPTIGTYRSDTSLLGTGTFSHQDTTTIRQHAYWIRASGSDVMTGELTNCPPNSRATGSLEWYCDQMRVTIGNILSVTAGIRDFLSPRVLVTMRIFDDNYTQATESADEIYALYQANPDNWYTYNDGSANKDKPFLLVFASFTTPWLTAPQWTDSRFNIRYMNGYFYPNGFTTSVTPASGYISGDLPYWNFVENTEDPLRTGYYQHVYRRVPTDTTQSEQTSIWSAYWLGGTNWDGQQDLQDGKTTLERSADLVYAKPPRNLLVNRFNSMTVSFAHPEEGYSTDSSVYFEPAFYTGWKVYDKVSNVVYELKKQRKGAPGRPVVTYRDVATSRVVFESANYPTQYCVSATTTCALGDWRYIDVTTTCPKQAAVGSSFYLRTRNPFGDSDAVLVTGTFGTSPSTCP